jgi:hypothetical protein
MSDTPKGIHFWVNGIVANRDKEPYIQLSNEKGLIAQLSMGEARKVASDILVMASRTEADALILKFMEEKLEATPAASAAVMQAFRDYRMAIDEQEVQGGYDDPEAHT